MKENKPHLLAVDDEEINLEIMSEYLEDADYSYELASSGEEAWNKLVYAPNAFDVILLDRMMPHLDGIELLQRIRKHPDLYSVPVVLQSACALTEDVLEGLKAGASYYISKPYHAEELLAVIKAALNERYNFKKLQDALLEVGETGFTGEEHFKCHDLQDAFQLAINIAKLCEDSEKVAVGIYELLVNAIEHGNLGIHYNEKTSLLLAETWGEEIQRRLQLPHNQDKYVDVLLQRENSTLKVCIKDQGEGFDWVKYLDCVFDPEAGRLGRGVAISRSLHFDKLEYVGRGNEVLVVVEHCFMKQDSQNQYANPS